MERGQEAISDISWSKKLATTPCKIPVLKQASLFSCMTGLRISDILQLKWEDIEIGPDNGYNIRICTEKLKRKQLSQSAAKHWNYVAFLLQVAYLKD